MPQSERDRASAALASRQTPTDRRAIFTVAYFGQAEARPLFLWTNHSAASAESETAVVSVIGNEEMIMTAVSDHVYRRGELDHDEIAVRLILWVLDRRGRDYIHVKSSEASALYEQMCADLRWEPESWIPIAKALRKRLGTKPRERRIIDGWDVLSYRFDRSKCAGASYSTMPHYDLRTEGCTATGVAIAGHPTASDQVSTSSVSASDPEPHHDSASPRPSLAHRALQLVRSGR